MKPKNNCPKCGATEDWTDYQNWACGSDDKAEFDQSELCRERVKVQRLKRKAKRLTNRAETAEAIISAMRKGTRINAADHTTAQLSKPIF